MFKNLSNYCYKEDVIKDANSIRIEKGIFIEDIQPFCIESVNQLTENDIIIILDQSSDGTSLLKPTSIYFKNNCYVLGHDLIGTSYSSGGHFFEENFKGFTCLTLNGKLLYDIKKPDKYTRMFVLKCKPNKHSKEIKKECNWLEFCEAL